MACTLCLKFIHVASSQPLRWHNTNGGKGVLCMHVLRVCLVWGKGYGVGAMVSAERPTCATYCTVAHDPFPRP